MNARYDAQTAEVIARILTVDSNCLDIGARVGEILRIILRHASRGHHVAFEPLPHLAAQLRHDFPDVEVSEVALSETTGTTTVEYVVTNSAYSGLRRRHYDRSDELVQTITVNTARLDDMISPGQPIRFVKIDVEGGELEVLRGGLATLSRCRPFVVFEHGKGGADYYGTTPAAVHDVIVEECGLRISLMERWLSGGRGHPFTRAEFIEQFDRGRNFYFLAHP